jgi:hypothetical protein
VGCLEGGVKRPIHLLRQTSRGANRSKPPVLPGKVGNLAMLRAMRLASSSVRFCRSHPHVEIISQGSPWLVLCSQLRITKLDSSRRHRLVGEKTST